MREMNSVADRTGKKVMYAFNISDEITCRHHDTVLKAGGTCVMVSLLAWAWRAFLICAAIASSPFTATATGGEL